MLTLLAAVNKKVINRDLKLTPGIAKTAPYPVSHRDYLQAKVTGIVNRWLNRVTLSPHTTGPLAVIISALPRQDIKTISFPETVWQVNIYYR
jgi:hypothetical protein